MAGRASSVNAIRPARLAQGWASLALWMGHRVTSVDNV